MCDGELHMTPPREVAIGIVEDDPAQCHSLRLLLDSTRGLRVSFAVHSGEQALPAMAAQAPDVLIVDLGLPGMHGVELIARAAECAPATEVMVFTISEDERSVFDALRAGATGYITKDASPEQLVSAVRDLSDGGSPMSPAIARRVVREFAARGDPGQQDGSAALTEREREVLTLLARGFTYLNAASHLGLSAHTVHAHIRHIYKKMRVGSRGEAVFKALRSGLVQLDRDKPAT
jgi:DNA-binding NarL/FixJ family response regulator